MKWIDTAEMSLATFVRRMMFGGRGGAMAILARHPVDIDCLALTAYRWILIPARKWPKEALVRIVKFANNFIEKSLQVTLKGNPSFRRSVFFISPIVIDAKTVFSLRFATSVNRTEAHWPQPFDGS
jgi:hypothetical protein